MMNSKNKKYNKMQTEISKPTYLNKKLKTTYLKMYQKTDKKFLHNNLIHKM